METLLPNISLEPQRWSLLLLPGALTYPIGFYKRLAY
jgi:hypothetical protein